MCRRYMPLQDWEWAAVTRRGDILNPTMQRLLPGLCRAEYLAHRSDLGRRQAPVALDDSATTGTDRTPSSPRLPAARLEYRLYTLFAE